VVSQNKSPVSTPYNEVGQGAGPGSPCPASSLRCAEGKGGRTHAAHAAPLGCAGLDGGLSLPFISSPLGDQILPGSPTPPPSLSFATPEVRPDSRLDNDSLGAGRGGGYPSPPSQPRAGSPPSPSPTRFLAVRENRRRRPLARPRPRWPSPRADLPAKPGPDARGLEGTRPAVT
jgi:hypothetical protein